MFARFLHNLIVARTRLFPNCFLSNARAYCAYSVVLGKLCIIFKRPAFSSHCPFFFSFSVFFSYVFFFSSSSFSFFVFSSFFFFFSASVFSFSA